MPKASKIRTRTSGKHKGDKYPITPQRNLSRKDYYPVDVTGGYYDRQAQNTRKGVIDRNSHEGWASKESKVSYIASLHQEYDNTWKGFPEIIEVPEPVYDQTLKTLEFWHPVLLMQLKEAGVEVNEEADHPQVNEEFILMTTTPYGNRAMAVDPQGYEYPRYKASVIMNEGKLAL